MEYLLHPEPELFGKGYMMSDPRGGAGDAFRGSVSTDFISSWSMMVSGEPNGEYLVDRYGTSEVQAWREALQARRPRRHVRCRPAHQQAQADPEKWRPHHQGGAVMR